jgi:hypothetical protein
MFESVKGEPSGVAGPYRSKGSSGSNVTARGPDGGHPPWGQQYIPSGYFCAADATYPIYNGPASGCAS